MAAQEVADLFEEAACFNCAAGGTFADSLALALYARANKSLNPMADTNPNALLAEANCYNCAGSPRLAQLMRLALLARLVKAGNPEANVSAQALITAGQCYVCNGVGLSDSMELALLDQLPVGCPPCLELSGLVPPVGVTTPDFVGQLYNDTAADAYWRSTGLTSADWILVSLAATTPSGHEQDMGWNPGSAPGNYAGITEVVYQGKNVLGTISFNGFANLTTIRAPYLVTIAASDLSINGATITSIQLPLLTTFGRRLLFTTAALTSLNLNSLTNGASALGTSMLFTGCTSLPSLLLPQLLTLAGSLSCVGATSLVTVSFPNYLPTNGVTINFLNCALSQPSVDHVLARCVANAAYVSGTVNLTGGTNSAPSLAGLANKVTLIGRGVACTTN